MDNTRPHRKILRSPSFKRRSKGLPVNQRVQLQRVLGVTVSSNAGLSCDSNSGTIAYPAGCVVVLCNPRRNKQTHIVNATKKTVTCLAFSRDGKYLITGEIGHQPAVRIWDVQVKAQVAEFRGHQFGISCVAFSPNMKEVVSVGTQHDMMICVWNWKTGNKVASNKVSSKVSALAFSEDGKCFITVGNRHVRFWYLEENRSRINQTVPLMGRSGILGDKKDNFFCDVVAGRGPMCGRFFVITQSGLLCEFNEKRLLDKWVELRTKIANCITAGQDLILVGCAEGVVRVFSASSLQFICSLPKPHHLGVEVTTATSPSHMVNKREDAKYPDAKAIVIDDNHKKVTCIYNDRSVYTWDVHDMKRIGKVWSCLYHSGCIWALEMYPLLDDETKALLPPGSFLTASADDTIRAWNLNTNMPENTIFKKNIYSNELLKIVYVDPSLTFLCNVDYNPTGTTDKTDTTYDGKNGVRSIRVSPDGADLASGDRQGNIRIYDMHHLKEKKSIEAHESDIMCLEYSYSGSGHFLATSSRDRLIHVFDVDENYGLVQSLGDHSSSITAVRFINQDNKLQMISCGADKSILIRNAVSSPDFQFQLEHHLATKITLYDMVIDPTQKLLATACQDRNVRLYNIQTTKEKKCFRGSVGDEGVLLRIHLDPSGSYAATAGTDKNVCIIDFNTGQLVATMYGHSEVITGVKFANDLKHLITVSADGCIFVWRLPSEVTNQIKGRLHELGKSVKESADYMKSDQFLMTNSGLLNKSAMDGSVHVVKQVSADHKDVPEEEDASHSSFDMGMGRLPNWAKVKFGQIQSKESGNSQEQVPPKGKWAQRADHSLEFKSQLDVSSLEDTFTVESGSNTLPRIRRKTVLERQTRSLSHTDDDLPRPISGLCCSLPTTTKMNDLDSTRKIENFDQYKSELSLNRIDASCKRWSDRFDLLKSNSIDDGDAVDTELDTTEIIYPPVDFDTDLLASTYEVFAVDDGKRNKSGCSQGSVSVQDKASVGIDNTSIEDEEDPNDEAVTISNPTSPSVPDKEFLPATPEKKFARETFVEDSFTPVPLEKLTRPANAVDSLTRQVTGGIAEFEFESMPFSPRLSLSAKFMSHAQSPALKNVPPLQTTNRQDSWFSRNKMEMVKAMDDTRRSLLSMKLQSISSEPETHEQEDCPSPPVKLKEEGVSLPDVKKGAGSSVTTIPAEADNAACRNSTKDLSKSQPKVNINSQLKTSHPAISIPYNQAIRVDRTMKKSNTKPIEKPKPSSISTSKLAIRIGATNFKTTQCIKNKTSTNTELSSKSSFVHDKNPELSNKEVKKPQRLTKIKMYASTPNLLTGLDADSRDIENKPHTMIKSTSTSNLHVLSNLSKSLPNVSDTDSGKCSSSRVYNSYRPITKQNSITSGYSQNVSDKKRLSSSQSIPVSSCVSVLSAQSAVITAKHKHAAGEPLVKKTVTSQLALDQAKSIHLSEPNILIGSSNITGGNLMMCKSVKSSAQCALSSLALLSTTKTNSCPPVLDYELAHVSPALLAVAEDIEITVNLLHQHKQANIGNTISEFQHSQSSNLEASPLDLPERDQSSKPSPPSSSLPLLLQRSSQCRHRPMPFQQSRSSQSSADQTYLISVVDDSNDIDGTCKNPTEVADKGHNCAKDSIGLHHSKGTGREPPISSSYCHILPTSHNITGTPERQSDSGVSSESSDTDTSHFSHDILTSGTKFITNVNSSSITETNQQSETSGPVHQPSSLKTLQPVSVTHCQSVLGDFRSQLHVLKELFAQVDGRTDETAVQVLTMIGNVFHETQDIITDLVLRLPGQPQGNSVSVSLKLPPASQRSLEKTFQSSAPKPPPDETAAVNSSSKCTNLTETTEVSSTFLTATQDMLEPILSRLSLDLSEGIRKMIKEQMDVTVE